MNLVHLKTNDQQRELMVKHLTETLAKVEAGELHALVVTYVTRAEPTHCTTLRMGGETVMVLGALAASTHALATYVTRHEAQNVEG